MNKVAGIKGIRKFMTEKANQAGWHVVIDNTYVGYFDKNVEIIASMNADAVFCGFSGNGLVFATKCQWNDTCDRTPELLIETTGMLVPTCTPCANKARSL